MQVSVKLDLLWSRKFSMLHNTLKKNDGQIKKFAILNVWRAKWAINPRCSLFFNKCLRVITCDDPL